MSLLWKDNLYIKRTILLEFRSGLTWRPRGLAWGISLYLFPTFFWGGNIEKCPFTYWLNGRWFLQIVDRDSGNLYPIYIQKIVVLASEAVGGGSRVTELPCFLSDRVSREVSMNKLWKIYLAQFMRKSSTLLNQCILGVTFQGHSFFYNIKFVVISVW